MQRAPVNAMKSLILALTLAVFGSTALAENVDWSDYIEKKPTTMPIRHQEVAAKSDTKLEKHTKAKASKKSKSTKKSRAKRTRRRR